MENKNRITDEYNKLVKAIEINQLYLLNFSFRRERKIPGKLEIQMTPKFELVSFDQGSILTLANFHLIMQTEVEHIFFAEIKGQYVVSYRLHDENASFGEDIIKEFVKRNLPVNIWPYIRETISDATVRMGLPPLFINTLKVY